MKAIKIKFRACLFLWAIITAFSQQAFASSYQSLDLNPKNYDYLQAGQNTKAFIFEGTSTGVLSEIIENKNLENQGLIFSFLTSLDFLQPPSLLKKRSFLLRSKKEILKAQIFPFHFFW